MVEQIRLAVGPESPAQARRFVARHLRRWHHGQIAADAELATSELVTNAVLHAGGPLVLDVEVDGDGVVIAVQDPVEALPEPRAAGPADANGRGLGIISAVASTWGVDRIPGGKRVWFRICTH